MKKNSIFLILVVGICIRLAPIFFGKTLVFGDNVSLLVPIKLYSAYWLKQGIIPWWNPTIFAGVPWAEDISQSFFYPTTIIFALFEPANALNVTVMLHLLFTAVGMYVLSKRLLHTEFESALSSALWTFSPQVSFSINNLSTIQSIAWFPWVVLASLGLRTRQHGAVIFALVLLGQFMAGYPQHVLYSILCTVLLDIYLAKKTKKFKWRSWLLGWITTGVIVIGITAVAWVPFVRVLSESTRSVQNATQALLGSLNPIQLIKIFIPYAFDMPLVGFRWGPAFSEFVQTVLYHGLVGSITLIIFLRNSKYWLGIFFALLIFSMGSHMPGFEILYDWLPILRLARFPSMALIPLTFFTSIYIPRYIISYSQTKHVSTIFRTITLIFLPFLIFVIVFSQMEHFIPLWTVVDSFFGGSLSRSPFHTLERDLRIFQIVSIDILLVMLFSILTFSFLKRNNLTMVMLFISLDIIIQTQGGLFFGPKSVFPSWVEIEEESQNLITSQPKYRAISNNNNQPYIDFGSYWEEMTIRKPFSNSAIDELELKEANRMNQLVRAYTPDWNMPFNIPIINGYTTLLPQDFAALWQVSGNPGINFIDHIDLENPLLKKWSVGTLIVDNHLDHSNQLANYPLINQTDSISLYQLDALSRIRYENDAEIQIQKYQENPNSINFQFSNPTNVSRIIIADRYDYNWQAWVNGISTTIQHHEGMRRISVDSGINAVEMKYVPKNLYWGLLVSLATLATCIAIQMIKPKFASTKQ